MPDIRNYNPGQLASPLVGVPQRNPKGGALRQFAKDIGEVQNRLSELRNARMQGFGNMVNTATYYAGRDTGDYIRKQQRAQATAQTATNKQNIMLANSSANTQIAQWQSDQQGALEQAQQPGQPFDLNAYLDQLNETPQQGAPLPGNNQNQPVSKYSKATIQDVIHDNDLLDDNQKAEVWAEVEPKLTAAHGKLVNQAKEIDFKKRTDAAHVSVQNANDQMQKDIGNLNTGSPQSNWNSATIVADTPHVLADNSKMLFGQAVNNQQHATINANKTRAFFQNEFARMPAQPEAALRTIDQLRTFLNTGVFKVTPVNALHGALLKQQAVMDLGITPEEKNRLGNTLDAAEKDASHQLELTSEAKLAHIQNSSEALLIGIQNTDSTTQLQGIKDEATSNITQLQAEFKSTEKDPALLPADKRVKLNSITAREAHFNTVLREASAKQDSKLHEAKIEENVITSNEKRAALDNLYSQKQAIMRETDPAKIQTMQDQLDADVQAARGLNHITPGQAHQFVSFGIRNNQKQAHYGAQNDAFNELRELRIAANTNPGNNADAVHVAGMRAQAAINKGMKSGAISPGYGQKLSGMVAQRMQNAATMQAPGWSLARLWGQPQTPHQLKGDKAAAASAASDLENDNTIETLHDISKLNDTAGLTPKQDDLVTQWAVEQKAKGKTDQQILMAIPGWQEIAKRRIPENASLQGSVSQIGHPIMSSSQYPSTTGFPGVTQGNINFAQRQVVDFSGGLNDSNSTAAARKEFPHYADHEGTYGSEYSIAHDDGKNAVSIPTIFDGKLHSHEEAIQHFNATGEYLAKAPRGEYKTLGRYEDAVHNRELRVNGQPYHGNKAAQKKGNPPSPKNLTTGEVPPPAQMQITNPKVTKGFVAPPEA